MTVIRRILAELLHRGNPEPVAEMLTTLQPWPEPGLPEHIAGAALFLATGDSHFVTGHALVGDGGLTARGGDAMRGLAQAEGTFMAAGVDRGTTGLDPLFRMIE